MVPEAGVDENAPGLLLDIRVRREPLLAEMAAVCGFMATPSRPGGRWLALSAGRTPRPLALYPRAHARVSVWVGSWRAHALESHARSLRYGGARV